MPENASAPAIREAALGARPLPSRRRRPVVPVTFVEHGVPVRAARGEILVRFHPGTSASDVAATIVAIGGKPAYRSPRGLFYVVRLAAGRPIADGLAVARASPHVELAQPNHILTGSKPGPDDPRGAGVAAPDPTVALAAPWDSTGTWAEEPADAGPAAATHWPFEWYAQREFTRRAWAISPAYGAGVKVAVLDSGVSPTPSLGPDRIAPGVDFIDLGWEPSDRNGHGSHMATIIAGAERVAGIAPAATIVPLRVLDDALVGTEAALVEALEWVADQPDIAVVSMSLAFPLEYYPSALLLRAIDRVHARGIVMVAASGNDGAPQVAFPARCPEVIAVGAARLGLRDGGVAFELAPYSNRGAALDLVAFGGDLTRDVDHDGAPDGILGDRPATAAAPDGVYLTVGTSPAAAQVSGAVALLLAAGAPPARVRPLLQATTQPLDGDVRAFDADAGMGLVNVGHAVDALVAGYGAVVAPPAAPVFAAAAVVLERQSNGNTKTTARAWVELSDAAGHALPNLPVWGHFDGVVREDVAAVTDASGRASFVGTRFVDPEDALFSFSVDAVLHPVTRLPARPYGLAHVDVQSFALLANLGVGLDARAVALVYDDDALAGLPGLNVDRVAPAYTIQSLGTGLISSTLIFVVSPIYYNASGLQRYTLALASSGTGLAASAITLDPALFAPDYQELVGDDALAVRNLTAGTGLISSTIIWRGAAYTLDDFFVGASPAILRSVTGAGLAASTVVFDSDMLAPDLFLTIDEAADATTIGTGLISSTHVLPFMPATATWLGYDWSRLGALYPSGTGLISSTLILTTNPWSWTTFRPVAPAPNVGMSLLSTEATIPF